MNLIDDTWIPVRRHSGIRALIAPWQIAESDDPVIAIDSGRPDFDDALFQFLIGLLQTLCAPTDELDWADRLDPPAVERLRERFATGGADGFADYEL
ncbi:MAG TPA: type I-E CRISPR-associated protein Cse1/CasA, partial [Plasticicumulans sp.]|nr:type I-E CRISPR-associated protein Cse1/CasA [Plasticicumulans sp.]